MSKNLKKIAKEIKKAHSIALFTHITPDCDALGSVFGMYYGLKSLGKKVDIYSKEEISVVEKLLFDTSIIKKTLCKPEDYDLFIACDVPVPYRLGAYEEVFIKKENTIILDHHQSSGLIGKYNFVDANRSSCSEIIFDVLKGLKVKITAEMAEKLYLGLSSDTYSFVNSNTNINSFKTAFELTKLGANIGSLNQVLYKTQTKKEIEFKKYLWNNFKLKGDCAFCLVPYTDLKELKGKKIDCDNYSSTLISIQGVNYSFSVVEIEEGVFSLSMRSKIGYDVRSIAEKLGGGGHLCAAGAKIYAKNINEVKDMVLSTIKEAE